MKDTHQTCVEALPSAVPSMTIVEAKWQLAFPESLL